MTTYWLFSNKYFFCPHNDLLSNAPWFLLFFPLASFFSFIFIVLGVLAFVPYRRVEAKERKAMLVILRFVYCWSCPFTRRFSVADTLVSFSSCRFCNDNRNITGKWFIFMTMLWMSKHFQEVSTFSSSFFPACLALSLQDKMIFHVLLFFFLRYHDDLVRLLWYCRVERTFLSFSSTKITFSSEIKFGTQQSFSIIIHLHVIFINHNSIYVYGYLCKSGLWIIQSKFHLVDGVDE